jgi:integrase
MARKVRSKIENRTDRLALKRQRNPHGLTAIAPGVRLGYRRTKHAGTWVLEAADGQGGEWTRKVGTADDYEDANEANGVLDFWMAADKARQMARGDNGDSTSAPATWASALDDYEADLIARGGNKGNATHVRHHLAGTALLNKPVALLTVAELKRWRNDMLKRGIKPATVVRTLKSARASLNAAADADPKRITERPWKVAFKLKDDYEPIDRVVSDADVVRLVAEAYALDEAFGLFVHVASETGARSSQIARLLVADLKADGQAPLVMMPSSRKGKRRGISREEVPITSTLAAKLKRAAGKRDPGEPLLLRSDGEAWDPKRQADLQKPFETVAERAGIDETMYCLRHSFITRNLLRGVPLTLVCAMADTSPQIVTRVYARYISRYAGDIARRGLLDGAPEGENVVKLTGRR